MRLHVQGRAPLKGVYHPSGSSNEAISLIAAALLSTESSSLLNVPHSTSVRWMVDLAQELGADLTWQGGQLNLKAPKIATRAIKSDYVNLPVASILFLAPILAQRQFATLEWAGPLGRLHTHLAALRDLGIKIDLQGSTLHLKAEKWDKQQIILTETSVTATALICMLAAALGEETQIYNAASEPHLRALQHFLSQMGAEISGIGSNLLSIKGQPGGLKGASQTVQANHIEIASVAIIAAITRGHVHIQQTPRQDLRIIHKVYERLGMQLIFQEDTLHIPEQEGLQISRRDEDVDVAIDTAPWPGFPSDLMPIVTVAATQADGTTLIHEKMFNNRLLFVDKLKSMGAQIVLADPHRAVVIGKTALQGEYLDTPDVRIGLAMLAAALCAEGESIIDRAELIERHFEHGVDKLIKLGAQMQVEH
jgi:UDP-N-acetylglucosamine 1-carboxyvinyltransferase